MGETQPSTSSPLSAQVKLNPPKDGLPPSHHVLAPAPGTTLSSYLPHWNPKPSTSATQPDTRVSEVGAQEQAQSNDDGPQNITCLPNSIALVDSSKVVRIGFRNPWPSWHKPTVAEVWQGLEWGEDQDTAIDYALQDADISRNPNAAQDGGSGSDAPYRDSRPGTPDQGEDDDDRQLPPSSLVQERIPATSYTRQQKVKIAAKQLLTVEEPFFDFDRSDKRLKATWLGHAGVLVQLPPLSPDQELIRVLFDPIFSQRCSPTQVAGPIRTYAAPCPVSSLPPIDVVIISHNHYDHLDYDTIKELWAINKDRIQFVVPLGNKDWFVGANTAGTDPTIQDDASTASASTWSLAPSVTTATTTSNLSIPPERVTELDWWDEVHLNQPGCNKALRVVCTPAQHGSGRYGVDANCALWSSWFLEHPSSDANPTRVFFGGDTGCQFHGRNFPPSPPRLPEGESSDFTSPTSETNSFSDDTTLSKQPTYRGGMRLQADLEDESPYPACPAFEEVVSRLGKPNFLMLPISVGATISFLRSYVPLPDSISPFPRISAGLTAANHMPPWDAVGVFDKMTTSISTSKSAESEEAVCMAIHWGTFISGPEEILKTLGQLKWACKEHGIEFARSDEALAETGKQKGKGGKKTFIALHHGASITL